MGWLQRRDEKNQRKLEKLNDADQVGPAGGIAVTSGSALLKIAPVTLIGVIVLLVTARNVWSVVGAIVLLLVGGACCLVLVGDVKTDAKRWRDERRNKRDS